MDINELLGNTSAYGKPVTGGGNLDLSAGGWSGTQAPQLWGNWAGWAEGVARDTTGSALNAQVEGLSAGWQGAENRWYRQAEQSGLSRETAGLMWGSVAPRFESQVAQAQAQREAQLGQQIGEIGTQAVGAIQNSIDYQDQLDQTNYWNQVFLDEQKKARKWGLVGSIAGLALGGIGAAGGFAGLAGMFGKTKSTTTAGPKYDASSGWTNGGVGGYSSPYNTQASGSQYPGQYPGYSSPYGS